MDHSISGQQADHSRIVAQATDGSTANVFDHSQTFNVAPAPLPDLEPAHTQLTQLPTDSIPAVAALPAGSHLPYRPDPHFTGREEELRRLAAMLKGGDVAAINQTAAATGMGGIGKSQLAVVFAHRYGQFFQSGVAWISFADPAAVSPDAITACLGLPGLPPHIGQLDQPEQIRLIKTVWQSEFPRLLIFDNCEDESLLTQWLATSGGSRVLVTSRRSGFDSSLNVKTLPLMTLPRSDNIKLLRRLRPQTKATTAQLDRVADELGDLPLALHMAGTYLNRYQRTMSVESYLAELAKINPMDHPTLTKALGLSPTEHDLNVARTFQVSLDRLDLEQEPYALAYRLLGCTACFAPGELIPVNLLFDSLVLDSEEGSEPPSPSQTDLDDALIRLTELGFVELQEAEPRVHRLSLRSHCLR